MLGRSSRITRKNSRKFWRAWVSGPRGVSFRREGPGAVCLILNPAMRLNAFHSVSLRFESAILRAALISLTKATLPHGSSLSSELTSASGVNAGRTRMEHNLARLRTLQFTSRKRVESLNSPTFQTRAIIGASGACDLLVVNYVIRSSAAYFAAPEHYFRPAPFLVGSTSLYPMPDFGVGGRGSFRTTVRSSPVFPPRGPTISY